MLPTINSRLAYVLPLFSIAATMYADVTITGGNVTNTSGGGGAPISASVGSLSGAQFALTGNGLFGSTTLATPTTVAQNVTSVTFNPNLSETLTGVPWTSPGSTLQLLYNGATYTDVTTNFIVVSMTFAGPSETAPNGLSGAVPGNYAATVGNIPFTMTGTVTVHSGSVTGPVVLSIPISGTGLYSSSQQGNSLAGGPGGVPINNTTYQFFPPSGTMFGVDTTTEGAWIGKYGADGYLMPNGPSSLPPYASVSVTNDSLFTWAYQSSDPRALQISAGSPLGNAAVYTQYPNTSFNINANFTDGKTHRVALYLLDWDSYTRVETITIRDASTNALIDTETLSNFHNGTYVTWNLQGNVTITVTPVTGTPAVSGIFFDPPTAAATQPGFTLSATAASIAAGASGSSTVTVVPSNGFNASVTLGTLNWPAGITGTFGTNPTTGTSTLSISVGSGVTPGMYSLGVTGSSGVLPTANTNVALTVTPVPPSFTLSSTAASVPAGSSGSATVTVIPANGFNSQVTLAPSNWPTGITGTFLTNPVFATTGVSISVASNVTPGLYSLSVAGTSGALSASTTISLTVTTTTGPGFTLSANPALTPAGTYTTSNVTVNTSGGFNSPVTFQLVNWPAGVSGYFVTNPSLGSLLTVTTDGRLTPGPYSLTIQGTSGALTTTTTLALTVTTALSSFTVSSPNVTSANAGTTVYNSLVTNPSNLSFDQFLPPTVSAWPAGFSLANFLVVQGGFGGAINLGVTVASTVAAGTYYLPTTLTTSAGVSASVTVVVIVNGGSAAATYVGTDTTTEGGWIGKYGADGLVVANKFNGVPAYGRLSITGAQTYTWAGATTDPRALQTGAGLPGIASEYYGGNFSFDLNLIDGGTHQVALYLLDWDTTSRVEQITVLDAASNNVLSQQSFSGFHNGEWAVWNLTGHVIIQVQSASSATVSGLFFSPASAPSLSVTATSATIAAGATGTSTVSITPATSSVTLSTSSWPSGITGTFNPNPATGTSTLNITVGATVAPGTYTLAINGSGAGGATGHGSVSLTVTPSASAPSFTLSVYLNSGPDPFYTVYVNPVNGFSAPVTLSIPNLPSTATATIGTNPTYYSSSLAFTAGVGTTPGTYNLTINGSGGGLTASTTVQVQLVPPIPGFNLTQNTTATAAAGSSGTSTISMTPVNGFAGQVTLTPSSWPAGITGTFSPNPITVQNPTSTATINVAFNVTPGVYLLPVLGDAGGIIAYGGISLTVTPAPGAGSATFAGFDTTTGGNWSGIYGTAGYMIANGSASNGEVGFTTFHGAQTYTWVGTTDDPRALQNGLGSANRIASAYTQYANTSFTVSVNMLDNNVHKLSLYLLDWDTSSRTETITVIDATTNAVLDTQTITNFHNGEYASWNVKGNVIIKVTPANGTSPVLSGIFFN